jgi:hypothetical protein
MERHIFFGTQKIAVVPVEGGSQLREDIGIVELPDMGV